jgi:hypothetical protein
VSTCHGCRQRAEQACVHCGTASSQCIGSEFFLAGGPALNGGGRVMGLGSREGRPPSPKNGADLVGAIMM